MAISNINQVPDEVLCAIFQNLPETDVLDKRLVCKRWNTILNIELHQKPNKQFLEKVLQKIPAEELVAKSGKREWIQLPDTTDLGCPCLIVKRLLKLQSEEIHLSHLPSFRHCSTFNGSFRESLQQEEEFFQNSQSPPEDFKRELGLIWCWLTHLLDNTDPELAKFLFNSSAAREYLETERKLKFHNNNRYLLRQAPIPMRFSINLTKFPEKALDEMKKDPSDIVLTIKYNYFNYLPLSMGQITNITAINISGNNFKIFPSVLVKLPNLCSLNISFNPLNGIPSEISQLTSLRTLDLTATKISSLSEIQELTSLQELFLFRTPITSFPKNFRNNLLAKALLPHFFAHFISLCVENDRIKKIELCLQFRHFWRDVLIRDGYANLNEAYNELGIDRPTFVALGKLIAYYSIIALKEMNWSESEDDLILSCIEQPTTDIIRTFLKFLESKNATTEHHRNILKDLQRLTNCMEHLQKGDFEAAKTVFRTIEDHYIIMDIFQSLDLITSGTNGWEFFNDKKVSDADRIRAILKVMSYYFRFFQIS